MALAQTLGRLWRVPPERLHYMMALYKPPLQTLPSAVQIGRVSLPVAAARELHRHASLASVFAYDALADAWREVPTTRSWQSVRAFDWRPPSEAGGLGAMAHAAFDAALKFS